MSAPVLPPFSDVVGDGVGEQPEEQEPARPRWRQSRHERRQHQRQRPVRAQARWTGGSALATSATTALVAAALLSGPVALALAVTSSGDQGAPAVASSDPQGLSPDAVVAGQRAQQWVRAWLSTPSTQEEDLAGLWSGPVQLPAVASQVGQTSVADLRPVGQGQWAVTVAALVTDPVAAPGDDGEEVAVDPVTAPGPTTRFFQVPVAVERGEEGLEATVLALPAPVPSPASGVVPALVYADSVGSGSPVAQVVTPFLAALVTGQGDLAPYLSPGTTVAAIEPPAAAGLSVRRIVPAAADRPALEDELPAEGAELRVLADVELVDADDQRRASSYPLTLTARDGRWEITSLDALPVMSTPQQASTPGAPGTEVPPAATSTSPAPAGS